MIFGAYTYDRKLMRRLPKFGFRPWKAFLMATKYMFYPNMNCLVLSTVCKEYINMEVAHQEVRHLKFLYSSILLLGFQVSLFNNTNFIFKILKCIDL